MWYVMLHSWVGYKVQVIYKGVYPPLELMQVDLPKQ